MNFIGTDAASVQVESLVSGLHAIGHHRLGTFTCTAGDSTTTRPSVRTTAHVIAVRTLGASGVNHSTCGPSQILPEPTC